MVTVAVEIERALQLASVNNGTPVSPIIPPGNSSMCGPPTNPSETSGPFLSPDRIGPLQMSPAFSLNSSHSQCFQKKSCFAVCKLKTWRSKALQWVKMELFE